ncbi:hypothetical protein C0J52_10699 [Blattella germanica]|nr:hypothetical protein C0J52_10699 [Blattella germanica]
MNQVCMDYFRKCFHTSYKYFGVAQTETGPIYKKIVKEQMHPYYTYDKTMKAIDEKLGNYLKDHPYFQDDSTEISTTVSELETKLFNNVKYMRENNISDIIVTKAWAGKLTTSLNNTYLHFTFNQENFIGGQEFPQYCIVCQKTGHTKKTCEEINLPNFDSKLPMMTRQHREVLDSLCEDVLSRYQIPPHEEKMRKKIVSDIHSFLEAFHPTIQCQLFGSSCNGFGYPDVYNLLPITTAKVPILKFNHRKTNLEGDISVYNTLGLTNTRMLYSYATCDRRAKIFEGETRPTVLFDKYDIYFYSDLSELRKIWPGHGKNTKTVGELWIEFLKFYCEFDYNRYVISIKQKERILKFEKLWNSKFLAIEDPFDVSHNLGTGLSRKKPPNDRGCRVCKKIGHVAKDCPFRRSMRKERQQKTNRPDVGLPRPPPPAPHILHTRNMPGQHLPTPSRMYNPQFRFPIPRPMTVPPMRPYGFSDLPQQGGNFFRGQHVFGLRGRLPFTTPPFKTAASSIDLQRKNGAATLPPFKSNQRKMASRNSERAPNDITSNLPVDGASGVDSPERIAQKLQGLKLQSDKMPSPKSVGPKLQKCQDTAQGSSLYSNRATSRKVTNFRPNAQHSMDTKKNT